MEEFYQLTIDDWISMKESLKRDLVGVQESFVRIGYKLRQIEEQKLYERDGYASVAEFAQAEYHLSASTVSRFIAINKKYSIDGNSDQLRPEFALMGSSKLSEMLALPDEDMQMIRPETTREEIRELKQFNKEEPAAGAADDLDQLIEAFFKENRDLLNKIYAGGDIHEADCKKLAEMVNPSGNRMFKKGMLFLMMYEADLKLKKFGGDVTSLSWQEFFDRMIGIFAPAGSRTWEEHFGEEEEEKDGHDGMEEEHRRGTGVAEEGSPGDSGNEGAGEGEAGAENDDGVRADGEDQERADALPGNRGGNADEEGHEAEPAQEEHDEPGAAETDGEIAPAQKSREPAKTLTNMSAVPTIEEPKEFMNPPEKVEVAEVIDPEPMTRKEKLNRMTAGEAAEYLVEAWGKGNLTPDMMKHKHVLWMWLDEKE